MASWRSVSEVVTGERDQEIRRVHGLERPRFAFCETSAARPGLPIAAGLLAGRSSRVAAAERRAPMLFASNPSTIPTGRRPAV